MMNLEQALNIKDSSMWRQVSDELDHRINAKLSMLRICTGEDLIKIQNTLTLYEELKRLPIDVIDREQSASDSAVNEPVNQGGQYV